MLYINAFAVHLALRNWYGVRRETCGSMRVLEPTSRGPETSEAWRVQAPDLYPRVCTVLIPLRTRSLQSQTPEARTSHELRRARRALNMAPTHES
jgi:hypothetical protein